MIGLGLVAEIERLQRTENERLAAMTPEERATDAMAQLRYIASVEDDHWLRPFFQDHTNEA